MKKNAIMVLVLSFLIITSSSYATTFDDLRKEQVDTRNENQQTLTITAVGDIMFHMPQVDSALNKTTNTYEFDHWFQYLTPWFKSRDFVIGNLETTLSVTGPYKGYPAFKSPSEAASDLKTAGFNVLTTANNHSYDTGFNGLKSTIDALNAARIAHTGTFSKKGERPYVLLEKKGYKVALFAYTYSTNGITVPADKSFAVNMINKEKMKSDLAQRPIDLDFTIVSLHFGNEYQRQPSAAQIELVDWLKTLNVDVVLGSHPHVLQKDVRVSTNDFYVIYSMGNFISNQRDRYKDSGVVVNLKLSKIKETKDIQISLIPTWVDRDIKYRIIPLNHRYLNQLKHLTKEDLTKISQAKKDFYGMFTSEKSD
jgi:poly-gamma-glutamate synthesis protein (capsule biosynthesis protein)